MFDYEISFGLRFRCIYLWELVCFLAGVFLCFLDFRLLGKCGYEVVFEYIRRGFGGEGRGVDFSKLGYSDLIIGLYFLVK